MVRYSNLIKEAMKLTNNGRDLRSKVAGVHDCRIRRLVVSV